jgi:dTDP-glucose pyrophosphorylase
MGGKMMATAPTLVVLAAGMGSRYGGLKQIDPVGPGGETVIDYSVYDALRAGFGKVVFVIRRDIEDAFRETYGDRFEQRSEVAYAFQELTCLPDGRTPPPDRTKPWGTGHALLVAADVVDDACAVINADDFYGATGFRLLVDHLQAASAEHAMAAFQLDHTLSDHGTVSRGICTCEGDRLRGLVEVTGIRHDGDRIVGTDGNDRAITLSGTEPVSMNMWGFRHAIFDQLDRYFRQFLETVGTDPKAEFFISSTVGALVDAGQEQVRVLTSPDAWFGVTHADDKPGVVAGIRALVDRGIYPERLWS